MNNYLPIFKLLLLLIFIHQSNSSFAQKEDAKSDSQLFLKKNAVYATAGYLGLYAIAMGSYERMIIDNRNKFISSYWLRVAGGSSSQWAPRGGTHFFIGATALTGSKNSHIELSVGINTFYDEVGYKESIPIPNPNTNTTTDRPDKSEFWETTPGGALGYRFQKPGGAFIFRAGFGYPETAYFSLGLCL